MDNELLNAISELMDRKLEPIKADISDLKQGQVKLEKRLIAVEDAAQSNHESLINIEFTHLPKIQATVDVASDVDDRLLDHERRITIIERAAL